MRLPSKFAEDLQIQLEFSNWPKNYWFNSLINLLVYLI